MQGRCHNLRGHFPFRAVSSAVEHCFHTAGVTGSIPVPPTNPKEASIPFPSLAATSSQISDNPEALKVEEFAAFDVLRFILAATVMLSHLGIVTWPQAGNLAVQVFFALSGWLIGAILYSTKTSELSHFYFNRSTRIWIPYFFTVAALYGSSLLHESTHSSRLFEFLAYDLTFTHNWFTLETNASLALSQMPWHGTGNHFWSLAVEEQFYLVAPLIILFMPFGRKPMTWIVIAIFMYSIRSQYSSIALGVASAVVAKSASKSFLSGHGLTVAALILTGGSIAMIVLAPYGFSAPAFAISIVLLCARPLTRTKITRWLGGVSFPFYLNAWIGTFAFHAVEKYCAIPVAWYSAPLEFTFGLGAGALSYRLIDSPVMAHRQRLYRTAVGWLLGAIGYCLIIAGLLYRTYKT